VQSFVSDLALGRHRHFPHETLRDSTLRSRLFFVSNRYSNEGTHDRHQPRDRLSKDGDIAVITLNSPPVNALSASVRDGLHDDSSKPSPTPPSKRSCLFAKDEPSSPRDISEFGGAQKGASLFDVQNMMEDSPKRSSQRSTAQPSGTRSGALRALPHRGAECALWPAESYRPVACAGGTQRLRARRSREALEM